MGEGYTCSRLVARRGGDGVKPKVEIEMHSDGTFFVWIYHDGKKYMNSWWEEDWQEWKVKA